MEKLKNNKGLVIGLSITLILLITGFTLFNTYVGIFDRNVNLRSQFKAQVGVVETTLDNMKKVLHDEAKIPQMYSNDVIKITEAVVQGRVTKNGDGSLMKWIQERNPDFNPKLYDKLMDKIEALRGEFLIEQNKALAIVEQHDNLRNEFWSGMFLKNKTPLKYKIISSTSTKKIMETGLEDDYSVFE